MNFINMGKKLSPFDFVNEINFGKKDIMRGTLNDALIEKSYDQYIVNRALSYFADTIFFVNEMNTKVVDNRLHFTYLLNSVRSKKRFSKWAKIEDTDSVALVAKYYNISKQKAREALKILGGEQIEEIKKHYYQGGTK